MISGKHIPFIRIMARRALSEGKMPQERYNLLISRLDKIEQDQLKRDGQIAENFGQYLKKTRDVVTERGIIGTIGGHKSAQGTNAL
jgi:hypothetical protein